MTMILTQSLVAIIVSLVAVVSWSGVLARAIRQRNDDERQYSMMMPVTALVASFGTLASALGLAQQVGYIQIMIDPVILTLIASMGRGALAAAGIIVLTEPGVVRGRASS